MAEGEPCGVRLELRRRSDRAEDALLVLIDEDSSEVSVGRLLYDCGVLIPVVVFAEPTGLAAAAEDAEDGLEAAVPRDGLGMAVAGAATVAGADTGEEAAGEEEGELASRLFVAMMGDETSPFSKVGSS